MIVSHEWLRQFVPHELSAEDVGEALSRHCVTLDGIERIGAELAPFVVARVVEAGPHPDSDHLWVTRVDDGSGEILDVVCGAPNVVVGSKYPFARTGTVMPAGLRIEKRKIRGETSNGMLCSARELGLGEEHNGILELHTEAAPGTPLLDVIHLADTRLTLDVLPNRPDLLSHLGVAREVSAISGVAYTRVPPDIKLPVSTAPAHRGSTTAKGSYATVTISDAASCPHFTAVVIRGVRVGESPEWLVRRLASIGQRSINNVVDATNYVLHGLGHPVHAYDLATLRAATIDVRPVRAGEQHFVTLDGVERTLPEGTTVICDGERPVGLAGVMGGLETEVTAGTTDILLELAVFDPRFVRRVRRMVGINSDASYRLERGVDAQDCEEVARLGATLITQVAGGSVEEVLVAGGEAVQRPAVALRPERLALLLGMEVPVGEIVRILESLGCVVEKQGQALSVRAPGWRHDLGMEVDLIEEVARLVGFDALPDELRPFRPGTVPDHPLHLASRRVRDALVAAGMAETRPMPFTATGNDESPRVLNPLAEDEPYLRASVLDTLARRAEYNLSRMQGNLRLFEIGSVFLPSDDRLPVEELRVGALLMGARRPPHFTEADPPAFDAWDAKALAMGMARVAYPGRSIVLEPVEDTLAWDICFADSGQEQVGSVSELLMDRPVWSSPAWGIELLLGRMPSGDVAAPGRHAHAAPELEPAAGRSIRYKALPVTPAAEFDLALLVPDSLSVAAVDAAIRSAAGELLENVVLFDEFRGHGIPEGTRSLAWRLTWRHPERTLRDKELEGRRSKLLSILEKDLGITYRAS